MLRYDYQQFREALGQRIKQLRKERGLTHRVLVTQHGFHQTQLARIERGEGISIPMLLRLAEALDTPVEVLIAKLGEVDTESQPETPAQ